MLAISNMHVDYYPICLTIDQIFRFHAKNYASNSLMTNDNFGSF